jgi:hypothetical protein
MEFNDIIEWQQKDIKNRSYTIKGEMLSSFRPRFMNSVFLFDQTKPKDNRSVIFPQSLLQGFKAELLDDFVAIKKLVDHFENDGKKIISSWLYAPEKSKFNLKGHYTAFAMVGIPEIKKFMKDQLFEKYFADRIKQFEGDIKYLSLDDINKNNMKYFDQFHADIENLYKDLREHLINNYNYREGH